MSTTTRRLCATFTAIAIIATCGGSIAAAVGGPEAGDDLTATTRLTAPSFPPPSTGMTGQSLPPAPPQPPTTARGTLPAAGNPTELPPPTWQPPTTAPGTLPTAGNPTELPPPTWQPPTSSPTNPPQVDPPEPPTAGNPTELPPPTWQPQNPPGNDNPDGLPPPGSLPPGAGGPYTPPDFDPPVWNPTPVSYPSGSLPPVAGGPYTPPVLDPPVEYPAPVSYPPDLYPTTSGPTGPFSSPSGTDSAIVPATGSVVAAPDGYVRVATFNASLTRSQPGELVESLTTPDDTQATAVAEIIQRADPDVVLLNEFDFDEDGEAIDLFRENYLAVAQNGAAAIVFPYVFSAPVNGGVDSGFDLDNDGLLGGPGDAFGSGDFAGQYGMVILSRFPIVSEQVRTFQNLTWASMPGAILPDDESTPEPADWYSTDEQAVVRMSSRSHWDVPIDVDGRVVHVLASHAANQNAGDELRSRLRNAAEIAFWADYVGSPDTSWIVDDAGTTGGLAPGVEFVVLGDQNSDPSDSDAAGRAIQRLLRSDRIQDPAPWSDGGAEAAWLQGAANATHVGHPALDTADLPDDSSGNLRSDYVLPSKGITVAGAGVFWPTSASPLSVLTGTDPFPSSDHRLVWADLGAATT